MALIERLRGHPLLKFEEDKREIYENVHAIVFYPKYKFARIYQKEGFDKEITKVLAVKWIPPIHPKTPEDKLPVVLFSADTLFTRIHFDPCVKVKHDKLRMECTILWK